MAFLNVGGGRGNVPPLQKKILYLIYSVHAMCNKSGTLFKPKFINLPENVKKTEAEGTADSKIC